MNQMANAGCVNFDAEKIALGIVNRLFQQRFTIAKTNFKRNRCFIAEDTIKIEHVFAEINAVSLPVIVQRFFLGGR